MRLQPRTVGRDGAQEVHLDSALNKAFRKSDAGGEYKHVRAACGCSSFDEKELLELGRALRLSQLGVGPKRDDLDTLF